MPRLKIEGHLFPLWGHRLNTGNSRNALECMSPREKCFDFFLPLKGGSLGWFFVRSFTVTIKFPVNPANDGKRTEETAHVVYTGQTGVHHLDINLPHPQKISSAVLGCISFYELRCLRALRCHG